LPSNINLTECGIVGECTVEVGYENDMKISYFVEVRDPATGDYERIPPKGYFEFTIVKHPLANFLMETGETYEILIGRKSVIKAEVRNIYERNDIVHLELDSGSLHRAKFKENDLEELDIPLNPHEDRTVYIVLYPISPDEGYTLRLYAESTMADTNLRDEDEISVEPFLPPGFSELSGWAMVSLVILGVLIYYGSTKRENQ
jgi:hypothetical protein